MKLKLTRPLAIFDTETTGTNVAVDRIVELAILKIFPDGSTVSKRSYVNPEMPIPPGATKVHGITDEMVANAPTFKQISKSIFQFMSDSDLGGHNSDRFDIPLLSEEFARVEITFPLPDQKSVDTMGIMTVKEPRTLEGALMFYTGEVIVDAHSADADTSATYKVLLGQLERYPDLAEMTIEHIQKLCNPNPKIDLCGNFVKNEEGKVLISFGKHKDKEALQVFRSDPSYYNWMMKGDFTTNTKAIAKIIYDKANPKSK